MDKLFDLMTMAFKFQLQLARSPNDILLITLNHLDGIREIVKGSPDIIENVDSAHKTIVKHYRETPSWEMSLIRSTLLAFFQV